jgi:hypothetical protein
MPPPPARDDLTGAQGLAKARALREKGGILRQVAATTVVDGRGEDVSLHLAALAEAIGRAYASSSWTTDVCVMTSPGGATGPAPSSLHGGQPRGLPVCRH